MSFFQYNLMYNTQIGLPYHILIYPNFINFFIKNKLNIQNMIEYFYAKYIL